MWNERFSGEAYHFGTEPADFLIRTAPILPAGAQVLSVADGEGRNSVYLAGLGHDVVAMDGSSNGIAKARKLAAARGVSPTYHIADIATWDWAPEAFDAVVAIFIQFMGPDLRRMVFDGITRTLRPGGLLLLHGYGVAQLVHGTGGPRVAANLYTPEQIRAELPGLTIETLTEYEAEIDEGAGHSGLSALIDVIARKPA